MLTEVPEALVIKSWGKRGMIAFLVLVGCLTVESISAEPGQGGLRAHDKARQIFAGNVARSLGVKAGSLEVSPLFEATEPYSALRTGDLYAFSAEANRIVVRGFSSAEGPVAFEHCKAGIGQPGGITALLRACRVLDKKRPWKSAAIISRIAWCLNRQHQGEMLYDADFLIRAGWTPREENRRPRISPKDGGAEIVYFTMKQGFTGTFDVGKVILTVMPDYAATIERHDTPL
jgi:hypothetical protein